jgi:S1-C subfamily serine protease
MPGSRLLMGTELADKTLVPAGAIAAIRQYGALREVLATRAPAAADLFAEPWLDARGEAPASRVSWYAAAAQEPVTLQELPASVRTGAVRAFQEKVAALEPLLADPSHGPLLRAALTVYGRGDVLWTGDAPVLVNWGIVPLGIVDAPDGLRQHFDTTFRDLLPASANPWRNTAPELAPVPRVSHPGGAAVAGMAAGAVAGGVAAGGMASDGAPPGLPPIGQPPGGGPPPGPAPIGGSPIGEPGWRAPLGTAAAVLIAFAVVLLLTSVALAAGYYYGWATLVRRMQASAPPAVDTQFQGNVRKVQESVNDGLRRRIASLEGQLNSNICAMPGVVTPQGGAPAQGAPVQGGPVEGGPVQGGPDHAALAPPPRLPMLPGLPAPPDQQPVPQHGLQPGSAGQPGQPPTASNLAELLENSVVMVIGEVNGPNGQSALSMGSGFAVAPDRIITNLHVVENVPPGKLVVVNRRLGKPFRAEVLAHTPNHDFGQPDFALLKLDGATLPALALSPAIDRLQPVVAVGFPAIVTDAGDDFKRMLRGEAGPPPAAHFTAGEVSAIQTFHGQPVIIHTASINPGSSGGPVADRCGRVLGVNTFIRTDAGNAAHVDYALEAATLKRFLDEHNVAVSTVAQPCVPLPPSAPPIPPTPIPPTPGALTPTPPAPAAPTPGQPSR